MPWRCIKTAQSIVIIQIGCLFEGKSLLANCNDDEQSIFFGFFSLLVEIRYSQLAGRLPLQNYLCSICKFRSSLPYCPDFWTSSLFISLANTPEMCVAGGCNDIIIYCKFM